MWCTRYKWAPPHDVVGTRSDREGISFVAFLVLALHSTLGNFLWYYTSKRRSILARAKERLETILQFQRSWQGHIIIFQLSQKIFETQDAIRSHCKVSHYESTGVTYEISSLVFSSSFFRWESIIVNWFDCSWWWFSLFLSFSLAKTWNQTDGVTMLPTFMPVATQAAIKGLTSQQVESLGINLILNNTYHLNLRPGMKILKEAGGAHKFQGWRHNLLTV